jgi:hypothetical protein
MKLFPLILAGSLAANATLIGLLVLGATDDSTPANAPPAATEKKISSATRANRTPGPETWAALRDDDLKAQADKLRAEGFPPALVRAIIAARIHESFAARRRALEAAQADQPFWKNSRPDPATQTALNELWKAERKAIKDVLGPDPENGNAASLRRQFPNLSDDKIDSLAAIRDRFDDQRQDLANSFGRTWLPDDQAKMDALDKAMHDEFAATLTPQELEDYDLRTSRTANSLRNNLSALDVSEQEFRALYKLQSAFDAQFPSYSFSPTDEQQKARAAAQKQLQNDIQAALGDARYADYQRATNYNFRQTSQLVDRLELPPETATQVYAVQQDIQKRASALRQDRSLSADDRTAQLSALAAEAQTRVTASLGAQGFEAYKQYGGQWVQNLTPRPPLKN